MIKNWKITAYLCSPLAGEPPALDAILAHELSLRLGSKHRKKLTRNVAKKDIDTMPIPVAQRTIAGYDIYCVSDPILPDPWAEWSDYINKRFESVKLAGLIDPSKRKKLLVASGPYKMRHTPQRVRLVEGVTWFVRCDCKETNKLLKSIKSLGKLRHYGYGLIRSWEWEPMEQESAIVADHKGNKVLMRTVPLDCAMEMGAKGYRQSHGGWTFPYWHPENSGKIAVPC